MAVSHHRLSVPFAFPVHFTHGAWNPENLAVVEVIRRLEPGRRHRVLVVVDEEMARAQRSLARRIRTYVRAHAASLELVAAPVTVPGGEAAKNDLVHAFNLLRLVNDYGLDRQAVIVAMGGGAVLDMVSFAAAIAHRGVRIVRMPTTVLAQGDSGIAVKNGMNLFGKKNFIGTFVPPFAVIADTQTLETLTHRDRIAGVSEAVKVALLRSPAFYRSIDAQASEIAAGDVDVLANIVRESAELHLAHICGNGDPFELGSARPLDFGHWAAHKLESMTDFRLRHGEAVAIGMALDLTYSVLMGHLAPETAEGILGLLERIGFQLWDDALVQEEPDGGYALIRGLQEFREHLGGELHVTLLRDVGSGFEVTSMDERVVEDAIRALAERHAPRRAPSLASAASALQ